MEGGASRIAVITGKTGTWTHSIRSSGFTARLGALCLGPVMIERGDFSYESGRRATAALQLEGLALAVLAALAHPRRAARPSNSVSAMALGSTHEQGRLEKNKGKRRKKRDRVTGGPAAHGRCKICCPACPYELLATGMVRARRTPFGSAPDKNVIWGPRLENIF